MTLEPEWHSARLDCVTNLVRQAEEHTEEASQVTLSRRQLSSARVVCSVQGSGTVHNQQSVPAGQRQSSAHFGTKLLLNRAGPEGAGLTFHKPPQHQRCVYRIPALQR